MSSSGIFPILFQKGAGFCNPAPKLFEHIFLLQLQANLELAAVPKGFDIKFNNGTENRKNTVICGKITVFGTPGETRTHYLTLRRRTLYPGELRGHRYEINSVGITSSEF